MAVNVVYQDKGHPYNKETPIRTFYEGLSTDVKPVNCNVGSEFTETDTMNKYGFDGTSWFLKQNGTSLTQNPNLDSAGRSSNNSVFGEKLTGVRKPTIAAQFQYGFNTYEATSAFTNGGTAINANAMSILSTGTNVGGTGLLQTKRALRYIPGSEAYLFGTNVFTQGKANSYQRAGIFDAQNGYFIGYEGISFGISKRTGGVTTFIPQSGFNLDKLDGLNGSKFAIDPTKGNVYAIKFGYLGFACVYFEVMTPTGEWITFHKIEYPNSSTTPHILNSMLPVRSEVGNTGNNTDIRLGTGSVSAGVVDGAGTDPAIRTFSSQVPTETISATTGTLVIFRNKTTYNSITNYVPALLDLLSVAVDGNKNINLQLIKNPTITTATPTWGDVDANSTLERSLDGQVNQATGQLLLSINLQKVGDFFEKVRDFNYLLYAGETAAFVWNTTSGVTSQLDLGIRWNELF